MTVRPAIQSDVDAMCRIIGRYAAQGVMLPRSREGLLRSLEHYMIAEIDGSVIGCGGLQPYTTTCGEIYGLATSDGQSPRGTGRAIVDALVENARSNNLSQVFALTLAPGFFAKLGFRTVEHYDLPMKVWKDCVACPKFGNCDEIAMVLDLN
jgi:N-acetylglutamate synthase-like GNAT family acetyltransferase